MTDLHRGSEGLARWAGANERRLTAAVVIAAVALGAVGPQGASTGAQPQSLVGMTLRPVQDADALIGGLIEMFGGAESGAARGAIDRVVVVEEDARRLVLSVAYRGLTNLSLAGEVRGRDRRRQPMVAEPVALDGDAGDATIALELNPRVPAGTTIESATVRIVAFDPRRSSVAVLSRVFALPKRWNDKPAASHVVISVTPRAIGTAAKLGPRPDYAPPPRIVVPIRTSGTTAATVSPTGVRRDHRGTASAGTAPTTTGGTVRDHRGTTSGTVRDHRASSAGAGSPQVRDHRARRDVAEKARPATDRLGPNVRLVTADRFRYGIKPEDARDGAEGPAATAIELLEGLRTDDVELDPASLLSIATTIYPDKNPTSGIYYYHPRSYHLEWTPDSGYGMRILYGATAGQGTAGEVLMATRLESGVDLSEVQLATELLKAYKARNTTSVQFKALRPLPLEKDGTDVSFGSVLGQYSIPKEKVAITALSDVLGAIEVSWITDPVTKENLQLALVEDIGVSGEVSFTPSGGALAPQIPISIKLADRDSFGRLRWNRQEGARNLTPYPLRLHNLHALCIDPHTNTPILYTWSLDNVEVPPMARVRWDAARVPAWIDTEAKRIWVDYSVAQNCEECDQDVLDTITGGVTSVAAEQIVFHTISPLADVGGYEITAHVRSKFFDPKDRAIVQKSAVLKADNQDFAVGPIYPSNRRQGEPLFEYRLDLAMPDGTDYRGARWVASDTLRVLVGRAQLEKSLGSLPAKPEER